MSRHRPFLFFMILLLGGFSIPASADEIRVRLEPFPPLIQKDGGGPVVEMLKELADSHDLNLDIRTVAYSRARYQLRNGEADLIGLVPLERETPEFYSYARELDWRLPTRADLFSLAPDRLDDDVWRKGRIGTPWGNAPFFSALTGVDKGQFVESSLPSLVRMLRGGRIDSLLFARVSTMSTLARLDLEGIYYRNLFSIPAGLAVADSRAGRVLQQRLEPLLGDPRKQPRFERYRDYIQLPDKGRVERVLSAQPDG